jgi:hypothetical protein
MILWAPARLGRLVTDNSPMSLFASWSPEAARLPDRLDDLHGPWQGVVVLPVHLTWHGLREFDVALDRPRLLLYNIVLSQGRRNDLARFVNPYRLRDDWPQLRPLLSRPTRRACERKFGLRAPVRHRALPGMTMRCMSGC